MTHFTPSEDKKQEYFHEDIHQDAAASDKLDIIDAAYLNTEGMTSTQIQEVRSAALAAAVKQSPLNPRSKASFKLYFAS